METSFKRIAALAAAGAGLLTAGPAAAQSEGSVMLRLGATQIKPNVRTIFRMGALRVR